MKRFIQYLSMSRNFLHLTEDGERCYMNKEKILQKELYNLVE